MTRAKLPQRRASETRRINFVSEGGNTKAILITIGFNDSGEPHEVFCADFKAGTTLHAIVIDACILASRCLQHGDTPAELVSAMCEGSSLIGQIMAALADSKGPGIVYRDALGRPVRPRLPASAGGDLFCANAANV